MTTSPLSPAEIEATFGDAPAPSHPAPLRDVMAEWTRLRGFIARPTLPEACLPLREAPRGVGRILLLDLVVMAVLIAALVAVTAAGIELPENFNSSLQPTLATFALIALAAPLGEELVFRSWLSGRPGHLLAVLLVLAGGLGGALLGQVQPIVAAIAGAAGLIGAVLALVLLRGRPPLRWFARAFPLFFWMSTLGFALIHLLNFTEGVDPVTLVLVLPQFVLGALLAYVRVHFGLIAAIALHAAHNFTLFSLAALSMAAGLAEG